MSRYLSMPSDLSRSGGLATLIPEDKKGRRPAVRLIVAVLVVGSMMLSPFDLVPVLASEAPTPLSPADESLATVANYPPLAIPQFSWTSIPGTTIYRIQFSQDIGFATHFDYTTANTIFTPIAVSKFPDGVWYWHVRVESPSPPSGYSETMSFTKQWASDDNGVALSTPEGEATLEFFGAPIFGWQPVTGAASYRIQIDKDGDFAAAPFDYDDTTLATTHQPPAKLANGTYYWRVVPLDPANRTGTPSEVRRFIVKYNQVPRLIEPEDESNPVFTPTFRWTAVRGAQYYRLQYSTDPSFASPGEVTQVDTRNTTYSPVNDLPNDINYYWRVRVYSGKSVGDWSEVRSFIKRWYIQPQPLTPTNNYQFVGQLQGDPLFTWTPVAGASRYKFEINATNSFPAPSTACPGTSTLTSGCNDVTANTSYALQRPLSLAPTTYYWRVTPIDRNGNSGKPGPVTSFVAGGPRPSLIYPLYYYEPVYYYDYTPDTQELLNPQEDRIATYPLFMWHRVLSGSGQVNAYRVQVDDDPLFRSITWQMDTENLAAAPTLASPFTPNADADYFWRVCALDQGCSNPLDWSQVWRTRIDVSRQLTPTASLTLLRPVHGSESVETTPLLEWWPLQDADAYDVQISTDQGFDSATIVNTATVPYPVYAPEVHLVYEGDPANRLPYGTYYWRVRGRQGGTSLGAWSAPWRFQVAAQSHWRGQRALCAPENRRLIASDPASDVADPNYDLTTLYSAQSDAGWYFGFDVKGTADVGYVLYLDLDHLDDSGATSDAMNLSVGTIAAHHPEYAIYISRRGGAFAPEAVAIYKWESSLGNWGTPRTLPYVGGELWYGIGRFEMRVPSTAIGMEDRTGSAAVVLFSIPATGGTVARDTVPSNPPNSAQGVSRLIRFTSVSERLSLAAPPDDAGGDPASYPSVLPLSWHSPVDVPWAQYNLQVAVDPQFTSLVLDKSSCPQSIVQPSYTHAGDFIGDNTYYWRVRLCYAASASSARSAWSQAWRFERQGFIPENLQTSVTFATPTFSWDMAEGARAYELQVDSDPRFGSPEVSDTTARDTYTAVDALPNATYYWRVRIHRYGAASADVVNNWTITQTFTLALPPPANLRHEPPGVVGRAPTLCWDPLIVSSDSQPVLAAWKYRIQVSNDPTFSKIYDNVDTEQSCWTPTKGYDDGTYYWRAAMIDGDGNVGTFTDPPVQFTKQYPVTTLLSPGSGSVVGDTPTFAWTPINGAASYRIEVSLYPTFSLQYEPAVTTNNARYTPTKRYETYKQYYWRVAMIDGDGRIGPYNDATVILNPYWKKVYLPAVERD
jgi:hypothetical protein